MLDYIFLETERTYLRPVEYEDIKGEYIKGINDQKLDIYTEHAQFPHNTYSLKQYMESKWNANDIFLGIFLKKNNKHTGNIELSRIDFIHRKAKYAILLWAENAKGYGREASVAVLEYAFNKLNINRIELGVHEDNTAAIQLYRKLGFIEEGILRENFIRNNKKSNTITMSMLREEFINKK